MKFQIIVSSYNSLKWLPKTLQSIDSQKYGNYEVCVVDDGSDDPAQAEYIKSFCESGENWHFIINEKNMGAAYSQYHAIHSLSPDDEDIIVWLDGDDWFANPNVLGFLNDIYENEKPLLTYGSYQPYPASKTCAPARPYPRDTVLNNSYRMDVAKTGFLFNHLRTVKFKLFKQLDETNFTWPNGEWFSCCVDTAAMLPCLEMANGNYRFIKEILCIYNSENPVSDWRVRAKEIHTTHDYIINKLKKMQPFQEKGL